MAKVYEKLTTGTAIKPIGVMLERSNDIWPLSKAEGILDNGCGPGPIMSRILKDYKLPESCSLTCSDFSDGMITAVNKKKSEAIGADSKSPWSRVETVVQNAMDLDKIQDSSKSHITAGWVGSSDLDFGKGRRLIRVGLFHDTGSSEVPKRVEASPKRWWRIGL